MKKIILTIALIILTNCNGYEAVFKSQEVNFYIGQVNNINQDRISNKIQRNLQPYTKNNNKEKITIDLETNKNEKTLSKDNKGEPVLIELEIVTKVKIIFTNEEIEEITFTEKFNFNNQSNKFEFQQYKDNIENSLADKIFQNLLIKLRSI